MQLQSLIERTRSFSISLAVVLTILAGVLSLAETKREIPRVELEKLDAKALLDLSFGPPLEIITSLAVKELFLEKSSDQFLTLLPRLVQLSDSDNFDHADDAIRLIEKMRSKFEDKDKFDKLVRSSFVFRNSDHHPCDEVCLLMAKAKKVIVAGEIGDRARDLTNHATIADIDLEYLLLKASEWCLASTIDQPIFD